jgi:hypothetical protein
VQVCSARKARIDLFGKVGAHRIAVFRLCLAPRWQ